MKSCTTNTTLFKLHNEIKLVLNLTHTQYVQLPVLCMSPRYPFVNIA